MASDQTDNPYAAPQSPPEEKPSLPLRVYLRACLAGLWGFVVFGFIGAGADGGMARSGLLSRARTHREVAVSLGGASALRCGGRDWRRGQWQAGVSGASLLKAGDHFVVLDAQGLGLAIERCNFKLCGLQGAG